MNKQYIDYKVFSYEHKSRGDLIFINGFSDPYQNHEYVLNKVAQYGFKVIAINMPGHGKTKLNFKPTISDLVNLVREVVEKEAITYPVISGYSMGAAIGLLYAQIYPTDVSKLKLIAPLCYPMEPLIILFFRSIPFLGHHIIEILKWFILRKIFPVSVNFIEVLRIYILSRIFEGFKLDESQIKDIEVDILYNEFDEVISLKKVNQFASTHAKSNVTINKGWHHDIYFKTQIEKNELVDFLTA